MTTESKYKKIEELEIENIITVFKSIFTNLKYKYKDYNLLQNSIVVEFKNEFITEEYLYYFSTDKIDSSISIKELSSKLNSSQLKNVIIINSKTISKKNEQKLNSSIKVLKNIYDRDLIIDQIDKYLPEYWFSSDMKLINYEKHFCDKILSESDLKEVLNEKYAKIANIFIEPRIKYYYEDKIKKIPLSKEVKLSELINENKPIIITGDPGTGKSTTLKKIGEFFIKDNIKEKWLPVYLTITDILNNDLDIIKSILSKLELIDFENFDYLCKKYKIVILLDTIDELEKEEQKNVLNELNKLVNENFKFILTSRVSDISHFNDSLHGYKEFSLVKFSNKQVESFIKKFFINQTNRADQLLQALKENRIIDKLPITPLTLSLISILFEEKNLEIPATISDIYENFNSFLLGKPLVSSKIELIDISFKERLLSLYAIFMLSNKNNKPLSINEFNSYFEDYFKNKSIPLKKGSLQSLLDHLINNSGILYLKDEKYVSFKHDTFMEYYAAKEIFKNQREKESEIVDNFFDIHWQNTALFYGGFSKDMPIFLKKINNKISNAGSVEELFNSISGTGFLLQSLYQTDNLIRKESIDISLNNVVTLIELYTKLVADNKELEKHFKLPLIWLLNLVVFNENFNSITLTEPLKLSFNNYFDNYKTSNKQIDAFKALTIGIILNSDRLNEKKYLEDIIIKTNILDDNVLKMICRIIIEFIDSDINKELKNHIIKNVNKIKKPFNHLLETPISKLRNSEYDIVKNYRNIKLITEGKTDYEIIEHAYLVLNDGKLPYFQIIHKNGAKEVNSSLTYSTLNNEEVLIGLFDHDNEGIGEFNRLKSTEFEIYNNNKLIKKSKVRNAFAILLPIPQFRENYIKEKQVNNYLEIEHYFNDHFLNNYESLKNTDIIDIYSIADSKKKKLSEEIRKIYDQDFFENFRELFEIINFISTP